MRLKMRNTHDPVTQYGQCHCGNLSFEWRRSHAPIAGRRCTCSFCHKHAITWTSEPESHLVVSVAVSEQLTRYTFGTESCDFFVCQVCGVVPVVISHIAGRDYAVVNVHSLDGIDESLLKSDSCSFDGETVTARLDRRQQNWIGNVDIQLTRS